MALAPVPSLETTNDELPLGSALELVRQIARANHALEKLSMRMESRFGITAQQRLLIRSIGSEPGMRASRLAQILFLDPSTVSTSLARLERKGLLSRRRDPSDARSSRLFLTAKGRALDRPTRGTVEGAAQRLLDARGDAELAGVRHVLAELAQRFEEEALVESSLPVRGPRRRAS